MWCAGKISKMLGGAVTLTSGVKTPESLELFGMAEAVP
jgi:hypothetical protein